MNRLVKNRNESVSVDNEYYIDFVRFCSNDKQTLSQATIYYNNEVKYQFVAVELAWKDNKNRISCIPPKTYIAKKRWSEAHGDHFHIVGVDGRSYILIHIGNFYFNSKGCLCVGQHILDINSDGLKDVTNSTAVMKDLNRILPDQFIVSIRYGAYENKTK